MQSKITCMHAQFTDWFLSIAIGTKAFKYKDNEFAIIFMTQNWYYYHVTQCSSDAKTDISAC